ncbi:MAG: hypothetical protein IT445_19405 [Phycisphaeraceae bacterium]|nr:hypothetical protein [Phycisphaeraceae bacterium]
MRIDVKDSKGRSLYGVVVNPERPPAVVKSPLEEAGPLALDWDRAIDDTHHLRRCPVCGCEDLYVRKEAPHVTLFALLLIAAVAMMLLFGLGQVVWAIAVLVVVVLVDLAVFFFAQRILVCYRCLTEYRQVPIRRGHAGFDRQIAGKYRRG